MASRRLDRHVAVQDLLQDFGVGDEPLAAGDALFQQAPGRLLVRMSGADQVHGDVRIDEDHAS